VKARYLKEWLAGMKLSSKNNPIHHTQKTKARMGQLIEHLREDIGKVTEPSPEG
jgi:hypothetical protein